MLGMLEMLTCLWKFLEEHGSQLWPILILEFKFKQHCVPGSPPFLAGRCHLPALGLGSISESYNIKSAEV